MINTYLNRWKLIPDGEPIITHTSQLFPVKTATNGLKAMLKLTDDKDEQTGCELMAWWDGIGAAKVLAHENGALLLERATGIASLRAMSESGQDDEACRIISLAARRLHLARKKPLPTLTSLHHWFSALVRSTQTQGGTMSLCVEAAKELLSSPRDVVVLHGDLHHDNVLDFGTSGWLAIDPKGLIGERGFDYANIFTNPDLANPNCQIAIKPERFVQRLNIVTKVANLERQRLLLWIMAWCGLSTSWFQESNSDNPIPMQVAELAIAELSR